MNSVFLQGSEDVSRAGNQIRQAASEIERAASSICTAADQIREALSQHGYLLHALMERIDAQGPRKVHLKRRALGAKHLENVGTGMFLRWGTEVIESSDGNATYTVALVEMDDGRVQGFLPDCVRFEVSS